MTGSIANLLSAARREPDGHSTLEAQLLIGQIVERPRSWVLANTDFTLESRQMAQYQALSTRLAAGEPLPYLLGDWEFYGRSFLVGPQVLIPRPETELLVERALELCPPSARILDLGTGSGCVAVSLACERPELTVVGSDRSISALRIARANAARHAVAERIAWVAANLLSPFAGEFDLVCANLPYLPSRRLDSLAVGRAEPRLALDGGRTGIDLIRQALIDLPARLAADGVALFEIDAEQCEPVTQLAMRALPDASVRVERDLAGYPRLIVIERGDSHRPG